MDKFSGFLSNNLPSSTISTSFSDGLSSFVKGGNNNNESGSGIGGAPSSVMNSGMNLVGLGGDADEGLFPGLSFKQRLIGFVTCLISGILLLVMSTLFIILPRQFGKFYTLGSLSLLFSTMFLVGPMRQLKSMFAPQRAMSTIIYLVALIGTLYTALVLRRTGLTLAMVIAQLCAAIWYAASYLPFAQSCIAKTTKALLPL